jgi:drug/metabolite transporter (DMT)-like permease
MYFATEAGLNVGVVTVIWSVNPLLMAFADRVIYKTYLKYYHYIGLMSIMICTIIIAIGGSDKAPVANNNVIKLTGIKEKCPAWIPVLFGIVTPCVFCTNGMFTKKLVSPSVGFNASDASFSAYFIVNILVLCFAIPFWCQHSFDLYLFWIGGVGSIINTLGLVSI